MSAKFTVEASICFKSKQDELLAVQKIMEYVAKSMGEFAISTLLSRTNEPDFGFESVMAVFGMDTGHDNGENGFYSLVADRFYSYDFEDELNDVFKLISPYVSNSNKSGDYSYVTMDIDSVSYTLRFLLDTTIQTEYYDEDWEVAA